MRSCEYVQIEIVNNVCHLTDLSMFMQGGSGKKDPDPIGPCRYIFGTSVSTVPLIKNMLCCLRSPQGPEQQWTVYPALHIIG